MSRTDDQRNRLAAWREAAEKSLKGGSLSDLRRHTPDGIEVRPLYTAADTADLAHTDTLPGFPPFIRGPFAAMYAGRPWTIRQYGGFATAEESNEWYRDALANGAQGISVAFDLATQRGYDSDHPAVRGEVGIAGVAIDTADDMKILFDGIALDRISVSMTMNGAVLPVLACFIVAAEELGFDRKDLRGTIQNDILKEFMVRNTYIYPPKPSLRIVADTAEYICRFLPRFNGISVSGYHLQEAGADGVAELAYTLANAKEYVKEMLRRGLSVDDFAPDISFFFGVGMDFYAEVAKLRAARLLWSRIIDGFGAADPSSGRLRMHCQTSGWSLTSRIPHNNIVRTTIEAMAAVFGGTQSLHTNALDEALALPSRSAARTARDTQMILQEETNLTGVIDPWAGSYMMESLTQQIADRASAMIADIDKAGGMIHEIESGRPKRLIEDAAARKQARIDLGLDTIVGVNRNAPDVDEAVDIRSVDNRAVREAQLARLAAIRRGRDEATVSQAIQALTEGARTEAENLLALAVEAIRVRATVGEITSALERVFGRHAAKTTIAPNAYGEVCRNEPDWRSLKSEIAAFTKTEGRAPRLLVVKLGQDGHDRGAGVVASAFGDLGFDVVRGPLFMTPEQAAELALERDVHAVGVSSLAGAHRALVPRLIDALGPQRKDNMVIVLGGVIPDRDRRALRERGVDLVFGPGTTIIRAARSVLEAIRGRLNGTAADE